MSDFNEFLNEQLKDPEFKAEWDALEPEHNIMMAIIRARKHSGMTQAQLAEKCGIAQGDISNLETGSGNPTLNTLQRLATAMDMKLKLEFLPVDERQGTGA